MGLAVSYPQSRITQRAVLLVLCLVICACQPTSPRPSLSAVPAPRLADSPVFARRYEAGEQLAYEMHGLNQRPGRTIRYEAYALGTVKADSSNGFVEEFRWDRLSIDGAAYELSPESKEFRQYLSLAPGYRLSVPPLNKVQPALIGPITDLLTFYVDVQLAMKQATLLHEGDHVHIKRDKPNSWADGHRVLLGEDAVDFDILVKSIDQAAHRATLVVKHVPPADPQIKLSADWMHEPLNPMYRNNWVQIIKNDDGTYDAGVGQETFEAKITISTQSGRIISASLDNPVEVQQRTCDDPGMTHCGSPLRYRIQRTISLDARASAGGIAPH